MQRQGLGERIRPIAFRLARQAVDEIQAQVVKARLPGVSHRLFHLLPSVAAADELEQIVIGALRAQGDPVKARRAQRLEAPQAAAVRIALHGYLRALQNTARVLEGFKQLAEPVRPVIAGRPAAEINAVHIKAADPRGGLPDVRQQGVLVFGHKPVLPGQRAEIAVSAAAGAKRYMDVDTEFFLHENTTGMEVYLKDIVY